MSVIFVSPPSGWRGEFKLERAARNYTVNFIVVTNDVTDGPNVIRQAPGVPKVGEQYLPTIEDADIFAFCTDVRPQQRAEDPNTWDVQVTYSTIQGKPIDFSKVNPLLRPAEISWGSQQRLLPVDRDLLGRPVITSSGNGFATPITNVLLPVRRKRNRTSTARILPMTKFCRTSESEPLT